VYRKLFYVSSFISVLLIAGCIDAPNPVGITSLPPSDFSFGRIDTFYATSHSSFHNQLYTSTASRFMIGKYSSYEAWACLGFYGWPDSLIGASITSATIQIRRCYSFGDSIALASFDIYEAKANLFGDSLSVDSLGSFGDLYYYNIPINSPPITLPGDTVYNIGIDTSIVRKWFHSNDDTVNINYGLVFSPTNSTAIKGFNSYYASDTSYIPSLYVNYIDTSGNSGTYTHKISISKYVSKFDTTAELDGTLINAQNGISYRGLLSFDDLLTTWPVQVHRAVLQLTLDSAKSSSRFTPFANNMLYAISADANGKSDGINFDLSEQTTDGSGNRIYSFEIRAFAERWLTSTAVRRITLYGFYEVGSFDLFTFYGSGYSKALKPRVIITYSFKR
jgi:hypothetical protein